MLKCLLREAQNQTDFSDNVYILEWNIMGHNTVKPLLSGPPIKRTPFIKRSLSLVPKLVSYIFLYNKPLFSGHLYADTDTKMNFILLISIVKNFWTPDWIYNAVLYVLERVDS